MLPTSRRQLTRLLSAKQPSFNRQRLEQAILLIIIIVCLTTIRLSRRIPINLSQSTTEAEPEDTSTTLEQRPSRPSHESASVSSIANDLTAPRRVRSKGSSSGKAGRSNRGGADKNSRTGRGAPAPPRVASVIVPLSDSKIYAPPERLIHRPTLRAPHHIDVGFEVVEAAEDIVSNREDEYDRKRRRQEQEEMSREQQEKRRQRQAEDAQIKEQEARAVAKLIAEMDGNATTAKERAERSRAEYAETLEGRLEQLNINFDDRSSMAALEASIAKLKEEAAALWVGDSDAAGDAAEGDLGTAEEAAHPAAA